MLLVKYQMTNKVLVTKSETGKKKKIRTEKLEPFQNLKEL